MMHMHTNGSHANHSMSTNSHGSTNFKTLYDEVEQATGFSMKKELNALITEAYLSDKYDTVVDRSAALTVGMQKITEHLYDVTLTQLIGSDDPAMHSLGMHAINVSFHKPHMHGGRGHSGEQDRGSFELMHVLNPRKDNPNVKKYLFGDNELSAAEGNELREIFQAGQTFGDVFGKGGGMSADGLLGQSLHPTGLVNLAEWAGLSLTNYEARGSNLVSVQFKGYDSSNSDIFLSMGKLGHGGLDRTPNAGREKFEKTFEHQPVADKLDFVAGRASGTADGPAPTPAPSQPAPTPVTPPAPVDVPDEPDNQAPVAVDDAAKTTQNKTIRVDVLDNDSDADGGKLTLTKVAYDGESSLVSIEGDKVKVNPLKAHNDDRTETIYYTVADQDGATSTGTLRVDISGGVVRSEPVPQPAPAPVTEPVPVPEPAPNPVPEILDPKDAAADTLDFFLVNTATDRVVGQIENGGKLSAADVDGPMSVFAMDVAGDGIEVGAVRLSYGSYQRLEGVEPYALFGNRGDNFLGGAEFEIGNHEIDVDVFDADRQLVDSFELSFDFV